VYSGVQSHRRHHQHYENTHKYHTMYYVGAIFKIQALNSHQIGCSGQTLTSQLVDQVQLVIFYDWQQCCKFTSMLWHCWHGNKERMHLFAPVKQNRDSQQRPKVTFTRQTVQNALVHRYTRVCWQMPPPRVKCFFLPKDLDPI